MRAKVTCQTSIDHWALFHVRHQKKTNVSKGCGGDAETRGRWRGGVQMAVRIRNSEKGSENEGSEWVKAFTKKDDQNETK